MVKEEMHTVLLIDLLNSFSFFSFSLGQKNSLSVCPTFVSCPGFFWAPWRTVPCTRAPPPACPSLSTLAPTLQTILSSSWLASQNSRRSGRHKSLQMITLRFFQMRFVATTMALSVLVSVLILRRRCCTCAPCSTPSCSPSCGPSTASRQPPLPPCRTRTRQSFLPAPSSRASSSGVGLHPASCSLWPTIKL